MKSKNFFQILLALSAFVGAANGYAKTIYTIPEQQVLNINQALDLQSYELRYGLEFLPGQTDSATFSFSSNKSGSAYIALSVGNNVFSYVDDPNSNTLSICCNLSEYGGLDPSTFKAGITSSDGLTTINILQTTGGQLPAMINVPFNYSAGVIYTLNISGTNIIQDSRRVSGLFDLVSVPLPASAWLMSSSVGLLGVIGRRKRSKQALPKTDTV